MAGTTRAQSFLEGALVLSAATAVVKILGALFKIPLVNLLGGVGMGCFMSAYDLFTPVYSLTVTGLSVAVSRSVSSAAALGRWDRTRQLLILSRRMFFLLGAVGAGAMLVLAPAFVQAVRNPGALPAVWAIVPAIIFSCISAAYRGYYQGLSDMVPTALSQVWEAVVRLGAGTLLAWGAIALFYRRYDAGLMALTAEEAALAAARAGAAGAVLGVTLSTAAGMVCILLIHRKRTGRETWSGSLPRGMGGALLQAAIPISLSALVLNLSVVIDLATVMNCLKAALETGALWPRYASLVPAEVTAEVLPEYLYGCYSGLACSLFNLVPSLTAAMGVSAIPAVSRAMGRGGKSLEQTISAILRLTLLLAIPAGLGLFALAEPILHFLYPAREAEAAMIAPVLQLLGPAAVLAAASTPVNSMLQALGKERLPLCFLILGAGIKLGTNCLLVSRPEINILGVPWGTLLCYGTILILGLGSLLKTARIQLRWGQVFWKPLFCGGCSAAAGWSLYGLLPVSPMLRLPAAIAGAAMVEGLLALLTGALEKSDLEMLPFGEKMRKTLAIERHIR